MTMYRKIRFLLILSCLAVFSQVKAQFNDPKTLEIGPHVGASYYMGDLNPMYPFAQSRLQYGGLVRFNYDNRWTPGNTNALYPRLTSENDSPNNFQNNTVFLADRSFLKLRNVEVYYNFPASLLERTRFIKGVKVYATHGHRQRVKYDLDPILNTGSLPLPASRSS